MPETEYRAEIAAPVEAVWAFVEVLENWAPSMVGFEKLEVVDDRRSIWTLRGDVGVLSRAVDVQADITRWEPRRRVEFTVTGLTERLDGHGFFLLEPVEGGEGGPAAAADAAPRPRLATRLRRAIARFVLRRITRRRARPRPRPAPPPAPALATGTRSRLTFKLEVRVGGPMAPMVELLMAPMLEPAAQDLADAIRRAVEARESET